MYDFSVSALRDKALFFADTYNEFLDSGNESFDPVIKWSASVQEHFRHKRRIVYSEADRVRLLYRPFVVKDYVANYVMNDRLTKNHYEMFGE